MYSNIHLNSQKAVPLTIGRVGSGPDLKSPVPMHVRSMYLDPDPFVQVTADGKRKFYLNEGIVKAAKDLVTNIQATKNDGGKKVCK